MDSEDKIEWAAINEAMEAEDADRERVIKEMRETQKCSKAAVYALQRGDVVTATQKLDIALRVIRKIEPIIVSRPQLRFGTYSNAVEEYVEAVAFKKFLETGKLLRFSEVNVATHEEYLGGISDLTGEMQRYAVLKATNRDAAAVQRCRDLSDDVMQQVMNLNLRNGNLRKKTDAIKYSVKRFETILYELSLIPASKNIAPDAFAEEPDAKRLREDAQDEADC